MNRFYWEALQLICYVTFFFFKKDLHSLTCEWIFSHTYSCWYKHTQTHMHNTITVTTTNMWGEKMSSSHAYMPDLLTTTVISCQTKSIIHYCGVARTIWSLKNQEGEIRISTRKTDVELRPCAKTPVTPARTAGIFSMGMNPHWHSHGDRTRPERVIIRALPQK